VQAKETFAKITGEPFKDSTLVYQRVFQADKDRWVYGAETPTGKKNPSFDSDVLATFQNPAAKCVLDWRKAKSDANYYHGFLYEADRAGVIHASFNQHIAATGRFSSSNPNLQNLTKDEDVGLSSEFVVRRAIIPRPGNVFHMLDYDQMEYRLMLDYAARFANDADGVLALIAKVLAGLDVHQATADVAQIDRRSAKTVNFATLYGSGIKNLSGRLGVTEQRARDIRDSIFRAAPEIRQFIRRVSDTAEKRGYIVNWFGRKCSFPDATYSYRAPNYIIQGGCADIVKVAMNKIHAYLQPYQTKLVLMIHDELVLEGPPAEGPLVIPEVKRIMENVYPHRFLPLTCDVEHSYRSLADKVKGVACVSTLGKELHCGKAKRRA
jgi:DNA polymerase-1